jgi:type I restriction enzyme S subunit
LYNHSFQEVNSFINQEISQGSVRVGNGTILLTGSGETKEDIGKAVVYYGLEDLWVGGDIIILKPNSLFSPFFLTYLINCEYH